MAYDGAKESRHSKKGQSTIWKEKLSLLS